MMDPQARQSDGSGLNSYAGAATGSPAEQTTGRLNNRLRVLLAESAGGVRERMASILEQQGFDVMLAEDGFDVLCRLPELRPDLLLMATTLPRLTGQQVCALVRQSPDFSELTVILLSENGNLLDRAQADLSGADGCLCKPFRLADLQSALDGLQPRENRAYTGAS